MPDPPVRVDNPEGPPVARRTGLFRSSLVRRSNCRTIEPTSATVSELYMLELGLCSQDFHEPLHNGINCTCTCERASPTVRWRFQDVLRSVPRKPRLTGAASILLFSEPASCRRTGDTLWRSAATQRRRRPAKPSLIDVSLFPDFEPVFTLGGSQILHLPWFARDRHAPDFTPVQRGAELSVQRSSTFRLP